LRERALLGTDTKLFKIYNKYLRKRRLLVRDPRLMKYIYKNKEAARQIFNADKLFALGRIENKLGPGEKMLFRVLEAEMEKGGPQKQKSGGFAKLYQPKLNELYSRHFGKKSRK